MKSLKLVLPVCGLLLLGDAVSAQRGKAGQDGTVDRPAYFTFSVLDATPTSTTLDNAASVEALDVVVNSFDVSSGSTVTAASIVDPKQPRTLVVKLYDASGANLDGSVEIVGKNVFGQYVSDTLNFANGGGWAETTHAYADVLRVDYALNDEASGDLLHISPYDGFGLPIRNAPSLVSVTVLSSGTATRTTAYTWDEDACVLKLTTPPAVGDVVTVTAFQTGYIDPIGGAAPAATASTSALP